MIRKFREDYFKIVDDEIYVLINGYYYGFNLYVPRKLKKILSINNDIFEMKRLNKFFIEMVEYYRLHNKDNFCKTISSYLTLKEIDIEKCVELHICGNCFEKIPEKYKKYFCLPDECFCDFDRITSQKNIVLDKDNVYDMNYYNILNSSDNVNTDEPPKILLHQRKFSITYDFLYRLWIKISFNHIKNIYIKKIPIDYLKYKSVECSECDGSENITLDHNKYNLQKIKILMDTCDDVETKQKVLEIIGNNIESAYTPYSSTKTLRGLLNKLSDICQKGDISLKEFDVVK